MPPLWPFNYAVHQPMGIKESDTSLASVFLKVRRRTHAALPRPCPAPP